MRDVLSFSLPLPLFFPLSLSVSPVSGCPCDLCTCRQLLALLIQDWQFGRGFGQQIKPSAFFSSHLFYSAQSKYLDNLAWYFGMGPLSVDVS